MIGFGLAVASEVAAATFDWNNTGSGTFSNAANWLPVGGPPGPADTARFALGSGVNSNVTFSGHATLNTYTQNSGNVTLFLNGFTLQATAVNFSGMGSSNSTSALRIVNGNFQPAGFTVGGNITSTSTLTLDATTMTVNSGVFQVGNNGTGTLIVQNGSQLTTNADTRLATNDDGIGTATVNGSGSSWSIPNSALRVGVNNNAAVNVLNGGAITAHSLELAEGMNSTGTLNVSGAGATFTTNGNANIGGLSALTPAISATLNVGAGGTVNLNGTTNFRTNSTLNVTGGTLNLNVANIAGGANANWTAGTISFTNGSALTPAMLGYLLGGTHILGTNRTLSASVGIANLTTPLAVNGGTLSANQLVVNSGLSIGAFGTVYATDTLEIGAGQTVEIENFGQMGASVLMHNNGGTLHLKGPSAVVTEFMANNFGLVHGTGRFADGMNNGIGGIIRAEAGDHIIIEGPGLTNPGRIELLGGTVEYTGVLSNLGNGSIMGRGVFRGGSANLGGNGVSNQGVMAFSAGTTDIYGDVNNAGGTGKIVAAGGSVVTFYDDVAHNGAEIRANAGSRVVFFGALTGAGSFPGAGVIESNGDLKPGNSPAAISFGGDLELGSTSNIEIEIEGLIPGDRYDQLNIAQQASLDGTLDIVLNNGFVPVAGDAFDIVTWNTRSGAFDAINNTYMGQGLYFKPLYEPTTLTLLTTQAGIGDTDLDGDVDLSDLGNLATSYGANNAGIDWIHGDFDHDDDVDLNDLGALATYYGAGSAQAFADFQTLIAVPEPASAAMFMLLAMLCRRRPAD